MTIQASLVDYGWSPFFQSQLEDDEPATTSAARVVVVHRARLELQGPGIDLDIPPFYCERQQVSATVGDWLLLDDDTCRPRRLLERSSVFKRVAAGTGQELQYIAANIDTVFVVMSCNQDFNIARLERYLALTREARVTPVIVLTKADLAPPVADFVQAARRVRAGVDVEPVNALDSADVARLAAWCGRGQTVALLGSSGVGKSTLVATLTGATPATQPVREDDDRGRHTTTRRELYRLPAGGWLLDTPGMRELQLVDVASGLADVFADVEAAASSCRFPDCRHDSEPGCAIQQGIQSGELDAARVDRWRKLAAENARNTETQAARRARERRFGRMVRQVFADKRRRREDN